MCYVESMAVGTVREKSMETTELSWKILLVVIKISFWKS
jgi:hypothetical protein